MTNESLTLNPDTEGPSAGTIPGDRLWRITDVAAYLNVSENMARDIIDNEADCPRPIITRGKVRLWSGAQWHAWALKRAGLDYRRDVDSGPPAGETWTGRVA